MRILHVNKFLYRRGGAEAYMEDVAALQAQAGHDVAFFGMTHPLNTHTEWSRYFPSEIEFDPLPADIRSRARTAARTLWSSSARRGMTQVVRRFRPDVVHFHNIYHHLSPSVIEPARASGAATVLTLHDYKLACPTYLFMAQGQVCEACLDGKFRHAAQKRCKGGSLMASALLAAETGIHRRTRAYGGVQTFVCPSNFMRQKMLQSGVFPDRLEVLPNFVDLPTAQPRRNPAGPIVYASRLSSEKGPDVAVAAMAHLGDVPGAELHIAGEGPQSGALRELAARVAPDRVRFLGRLDKSDVAERIATASVVVAPSRCYENQPLTVLEAMSAGVPVVGSALGGVAELIRPGVTGQLVPPDDPQALARELRSVLADPDADAMGLRGRDLIAAQFSPQHHLDRLTELYDRALADRAAPDASPATPATPERTLA